MLEAEARGRPYAELRALFESLVHRRKPLGVAQDTSPGASAAPRST